MWAINLKAQMPAPEAALPGRTTRMEVPETHFVNGNRMIPPFPDGLELALFGMGCFWGAERMFWQMPGIYITAVGYAAGYTPNPHYSEVCSGQTGHNEVVQVVFNPLEASYLALLQTFWQGHDPTHGMRQGNDIGTQYRSGIYCYSDLQHAAAERTAKSFSRALADQGFSSITTERIDAPEFFYAEPEHQQYLAKNPGGYCGIGGTGVDCSFPA